MMPFTIVVVGMAPDAAAHREVVALAAQSRPEQQSDLRREFQQAAREVAQEARAAAQEARAAAQQARDGADPAQAGQAAVAQVPAAPPVPDLPGMPRVTKGTDGRMTIVGPDGSTTILEPDGRYTVVNARGHVSQSARALSPDQYGIDPGAVVSMVGVASVFFFVLGRWWARRSLVRRAGGLAGLEGAAQSEMGERMQRIEQAVEAVAIEVERVSEGQRFTTRLLSEMRTPSPLAVGEPQR